MKPLSSLAVLVGLGTAVMGVAGLIAPDVLVRIGWLWTTPAGLYASAVLDLLAGLVLLKVASSSRSPVAMSVLGAVTLLGGILTPFLGHARALTYARWWANQDPVFLRLWAALLLVVGVLIVTAVTPRRRTLRPSAGTRARPVW